MTTSEHLQKIKAKCQELLAIAERRTAGRWVTPTDENWDVWEQEGDDVGAHCLASCGPKRNFSRGMTSSMANAAYIAACAGPAEAGWRATIAAIDDWLGLYVYTDGFADGAPDASPHDKIRKEIASMARCSLNHIITAWPDEML